MNCADCRELLIEFSLGQLDVSRTGEVRDHLQGGCELCANELAEINETWARMAANLEPVPPSPAVEARLLDKIRDEASRPASRIESDLSAHLGRNRVIAYLLAASLAGIAAGWTTMHFTGLGPMLARQEPVPAVAETWGMAPANQSTTGFQTVAMNTIKEKRGLRVSIVMIPHSKEWHVIATGLPTLGEGETFQFWLESKSGEFSRLATLSINHRGRGGAVIDVSELETTERAEVWLTQETQKDPLSPAETVLFRAALK